MNPAAYQMQAAQPAQPPNQMKRYDGKNGQPLYDASTNGHYGRRPLGACACLSRLPANMHLRCQLSGTRSQHVVQDASNTDTRQQIAGQGHAPPQELFTGSFANAGLPSRHVELQLTFVGRSGSRAAIQGHHEHILAKPDYETGDRGP